MSSLLFVTTSLLLLLALLSPAPSTSPTAAQWQASTPQGMLMEDKIRLGSTPPSCRNRCNACSPCMAVQVPTLPGGGGTLRPAATFTRGKPKRTAAKALRAGSGSDKFASADAATPLEYRSYPNYKPLGWKCRCGDHLFNP